MLILQLVARRIEERPRAARTESHADVGALLVRVDDEVARVGAAQHCAGIALDHVIARAAVAARFVLEEIDDQAALTVRQQPILRVRERHAFPVPQLLDETIERRSGAMRAVQDGLIAHGFR
jgi:hypothetical protein